MTGWLHVAAALLEPVLDPGERMFLPGLGVAAVVALGVSWWNRRLFNDLRAAGSMMVHPSTRLDLQLLLTRQLLRIIGVLPSIAVGWTLATAAVRALDAAFGVPDRPEIPALFVMVAFSVVYFVLADLSRFALHLCMHRIPWLWAFHQVHHSAEVLTPLTFHRVHPVESVLYQARGALVASAVVIPFFWLFREDAMDATFLGVQAVGVVFNTITGNLRHSHVWWRFPVRVERWLVSPAQHQQHHALDGEDRLVNLGTWLAIWDRAVGTWVPAGDTPPARFGVRPEAVSHGHDLLSAWWGPFRRVLGRRGAVAAAAAAAAVTPGVGQAQEPAAESTDRPDAREAEDEVLVESDRGIPKVAGSAWTVDEEELRRFGQLDVSRVAVTVPGVYARAEDGFGLRPNIGIRGAAAERSAKVTLLEDGVPLSPAPYAAPAAYYFPLMTRMVGLEVLKGPAAIQHGPQTLGGAVQLATRDIARDGVEAGVELGGGSWGMMKGHGWVSVGRAGRGVLVEVAQLGSTGFKELDTGGSTGFLRTDVMVKGALASPGGAHRVELKVGWGREASDETYLGLQVDDAAETPWRRYAASALDHMDWTRAQGVLAWEARLGDQGTIRTTFYTHHLHRVWSRVDGFADGPALDELLRSPVSESTIGWMELLRGERDGEAGEELAVAVNDRTLVNHGVQSRLRWRTGRGDLVEAGVRLHLDDVRRFHTRELLQMTGGAPVLVDGSGMTTLDRQTSAFAVAGHTLSRIQAGALTLEPGLRVEVVRTTLEDSGGPDAKAELQVVPLPGLGVRAGRGRTQGFAGVHRGFSPMGPGDGSSRPESAISSEVGLRHALGERRLEVAGFWSEYQNLTGQCTLSSGCSPEQIDTQLSAGRARILGVEGGWTDDLPLRPGWSAPVTATFTWTHASFARSFLSDFPQFGDVQKGDLLPYVPAAQAHLAAGLRHERAELAVGVDARTGLRDIASASRAAPEIPALVLVDASMRFRLNEGLWVVGAAQNALGSASVASLRPFGARPVARRTLTLAVRWGTP